MQEWANFFIAQVGASAALTGLIFVGVSLNLQQILAMPRLPSRALEALSLLMAVLITSSLLLVPDQPQLMIGVEMTLVGLVITSLMTRLDLRIRRDTDVKYRRAFLFNMVLSQIASLPYLIAGLFVLAGKIDGLYVLVVGIIFSFIKALLDAWVLLVEINR
jgi:modulator of FtsH protease